MFQLNLVKYFKSHTSETVRAYVQKETHDITGGRVPDIRACELRNDAGVIGAAALESSI